jgi:glycosyltransferase involved in cell wall biosynthesis
MTDVSVCIITYNQEKFISQAIESVLMQETDVNYEIVIGEDCSTDKTGEIVKEYGRKYADKIVPLFNNSNSGMHRNQARALKACQGKYVALLDGDDYWTCPCKLQKQVDFLEINKECTICFHKTEVFYEDKSKKAYNSPVQDQKKISTIYDLLEENSMQTSSVMFRNRLFNELPDFYFKVVIPDYYLHLINAHYGNIGYIDEVMSAYRIHKDGIWSMKQEKNVIRNVFNIIEIFNEFNIYTDYKYNDKIKSRICSLFYGLLSKYEEEHDRCNAKKALIHFRKILPFNVFLNTLFKLYMPFLYNSCRYYKRILFKQIGL